MESASMWPRDHLRRPWMDIMGQAYLHNGQFEEALAWRNKAQSQSGEGVLWGYGHEVSILGHLGRLDEAKVALAELLRLKPELT